MDSPVADYEVTYSPSKNFEYILHDRQPQSNEGQDKGNEGQEQSKEEEPTGNEGQEQSKEEQSKEEPTGNEGQEQSKEQSKEEPTGNEGKEQSKEEHFVFPFYVSNPVYSKTSPDRTAMRTAKKQGERRATRSDAKRLAELKEIDDAIAALQNKRLRLI
jgi:cobalamin biosynthesis protein CobT